VVLQEREQRQIRQLSSFVVVEFRVASRLQQRCGELFDLIIL
jgi:hypothetical protein